jgi:hypothetical protein
VKVAYFVFRCFVSVSVFRFRGAGCFISLFKLYLLLCSVFMFSSFSFASLDIGYVFNLFTK